MSWRLLIAAVWSIPLATPQVFAQTAPQPFPQPTNRPAQVSPAPPSPSSATQAVPPGAAADEPTQATLGLPIYPGAKFLASFDAGRGQRYYLFGSNQMFAELVAFYKTALNQKGELVFEAPATHVFEVGRFREETMAFPPGVTVKDYTWNGSAGYLHVLPGGVAERYKTILQMVAVTPAAR